MIYSDGVVFGIQNGSTVNLINDKSLSNTVGTFFGHAKSRKMLSDRDEKAHAISLRLFVYSKSQHSVEIVSYSRFHGFQFFS
jgi:hypothetical protein